MSWPTDEVDPALLEDPEWQAALRAAESPQRQRPRVFRESPSGRAGPAQDLQTFYDSGAEFDLAAGAENPRNSTSRMNLGSADAPFTISDDDSDTASFASARTLPASQGAPRPHPPHRSTSSFVPGVRYDSTSSMPPRLGASQRQGETISLLDSPQSARTTSRLTQSATSVPVHSPTREEAQDMDLALAIQLQREFDAESMDLDLDIVEEIPSASFAGPVVLNRFATSPASHTGPNSNRRTITDRRGETQARPTGPQRGARGAPTTHGNTNNDRPRGGRATNPVGLPPLNRGTSLPVGPAHAPPPAPRILDRRSNRPQPAEAFPPDVTLQRVVDAGRGGRPNPVVDLGRGAPAPRRRNQQQGIAAAGPGARATLMRAMEAMEDEDDDLDFDTDDADDDDDDEDLMVSVHSSDDDFLAPEDEDEVRLRTGVGLRGRAPAAVQNFDFFAAINGRPRDGPGSRRNIMEEDVELAFAIQEAEYRDHAEVAAVRAAERRFLNAGGGGRGRRGGRYGRGGFEVDVNDYDAMLQLSERAPPVKRGTSAAALNRLPVVKGAHDDCTICQGTADSVMIALPCMHAFHKECIMPHLKSNRFCPNCRHELE